MHPEHTNVLVARSRPRLLHREIRTGSEEADSGNGGQILAHGASLDLTSASIRAIDAVACSGCNSCPGSNELALAYDTDVLNKRGWVPFEEFAHWDRWD